MESGWTQDLLNWLSAHPGWGWALVFSIALLESLALVGLLLPGIMILFGVGALIGLGAMEMLPIWLAASAGAFIGDSLSYTLGHRFREHLMDFWPFSRYPEVMNRGREFFRRHGEKSVFAGRFIGPLRPIIPAVVGIMGMKASRFLVADLAASVAWAPTFLLPGLLFGASLEVASEYTGRLATVLVILLFALWFTWWILRSVYKVLAGRSARWLRRAINWTRRHPVLGRITGPLLDPSQPEVLSVTMLGLLLVLLFWGLIMLTFLGPFAPQPQAIDQAVADYALALRNEITDPLMVGLSQLSRWQVTVLSAVAVLLWLLGAGQLNAALHWVAAIGGGALIQLLLAWGLRATPQVLAVNSEGFRGPSSAMSLSTVVLSFFAVMVAKEFRRNHRQWPYLIAGLMLILLFMARIYLGLEWFSGALMGLLLGLAWVGVLGIAYRQRRLQPFSGATASMIFYSALALLFTWQVQVNTATDRSRLSSPIIEQEMNVAFWWQSGWAALPTDRTQLVSAAARRFNVQSSVRPQELARLLERAGWERSIAADWRWILSALNPRPDEASLPLLGRSYQGHSEALLMRRDLPDGSVQTFRLWDSGVRLLPRREVLYLGQVSGEQLVQPLRVFSYWRSAPLGGEGLFGVAHALRGLDHRFVNGDLLLLRENQD